MKALIINDFLKSDYTSFNEFLEVTPSSKDDFTDLEINKITEHKKVLELNKSGYAGINSLGTIVDRIENPNAIPIQENSLFGVVEPKKLPKHVICAFNDKYMIFEDGRVYSNWFGGRFIKAYGYKSEKGVVHFAVPISRDRKKFRVQVSRLVAFHFKKHNYKDIDDMPPIIFKDNNTSNFDKKNLLFSKKGDVLRKIKKLYPKSYSSTKIKDTRANIQKIKRYLKSGLSYGKIGEKYNCSDMSVHRFLKRNNII